MTPRKKQSVVVLIGSVVALAAGTLGVGCASSTQHHHPQTAGASTAHRAGVLPATPRDLGPLVLPTDGVLAYERSEGGPGARYAWFEQGRNNGGVSARTDLPILATRQWPIPPQPAEHWIRFYRWDQRR